MSLLREMMEEFIFDELMGYPADKIKVSLRQKHENKELLKRFDEYASSGRGSRLYNEQDFPGGIDFKGLTEYLKGKIISIAEKYWRIPDRAKAERYLDTMLEFSYSYAHAETAIQKREVCGLIFGLLGVIKVNLIDVLEPNEKLMLAEINDEFRKLEEQVREFRTSFEYKDSFAKHIDCIRENEKNPSREFDYNTQFIPFRGRDEALIGLREFCDAPENFSWWTVTGSGGIGKSRLLLEFIESNKFDIKWKMLFHPTSGLKDGVLFQYSDINYEKNVLLIIDDASSYAYNIGKWFLKLMQYGKIATKLRVILVERESPVNDQNPLWYDQLLQGMEGYPSHQYSHLIEGNFLRLHSLIGRDTQNIFKNYIFTKFSIEMDDEICETLVTQLEKIDPQQSRPLYAMFLADAYIEKKGEITNWDSIKLNEYIYIREQRRIAGIIGTGDIEDDYVVASLWLLSYATLTDNALYLQTSPKCLQSQFDILRSRFSHSSQRFSQALESISSSKILGAIAPFKPDIAGEFIVYKQFDKYSRVINIVEFVQTAWEDHPYEYSQFLTNLYRDFQQNLFRNAIFHILFCPPIISNFDTLISLTYAISNVLYYVDSNRFEFIDYLEVLLNNLYGIIHDVDLKLALARGFLNLLCKQRDAKACKSLTTIEKLYVDSHNNVDFTIVYAKALVSLSMGKEMKIELLRNKLKELYDLFPNNLEIAIEYAYIIVNELNYVCDKCLVDILMGLNKAYPKSSEILIAYAKGSINYMGKQEYSDAKNTANVLEFLLENNSNNRELAFIVCYSIIMLSTKHDCGMSSDMQNRFNVLLEKYAFTEDDMKEMLPKQLSRQHE